MRILLISNAHLENGRGPIFRLFSILPRISAKHQIIFVALGEVDPYCASLIGAYCRGFYKLNILFDGWFVINKTQIADDVYRIVQIETPDITILSWEIWDLMDSISSVLRHHSFAVVLHSTPFVDALPHPRSFITDVVRRIIIEDVWKIIKYILARVWSTSRILKRLNVIPVNKTVEYYLKTYFPTLPIYSLSHSYALNLREVDASKNVKKLYDFCFMAKLEESKGIFELLYIVKEMRKKKQDVRILILGSFENEADKKKFHKILTLYNLNDNFHLVGWISGSEKYQFLKKAKVFLYPALWSDTFSICLLEALSCSLPVVCYKLPFTEITYTTQAVIKTEFKNHVAFAKEALRLLHDQKLYQQLSEQARRFVVNEYSSWQRVADSEVEVYEEIVSRNERVSKIS